MPKMSVKVRGAYDDDYVSSDHDTLITSPSCTKQCFKDECDINTLVSRWQKSGSVGSNFTSVPGEYADVSQAVDYHTALNIVIDAQQRFNELPAHVRDRFKNDPGSFLAFMGDEANTEEAVSLGLAIKRETGAEQPPELSGATVSQPPKEATTAVSAPTGG